MSLAPFYASEGITIYCGDARELLPQIAGPFDVVLTDPPWGINGGSGGINKARGRGNYGGAFPDTPEYIASVVVPVIRALIARCGCVVLTPGAKNCCLYPQPDSFGCFYAPGSACSIRFAALAPHWWRPKRWAVPQWASISMRDGVSWRPSAWTWCRAACRPNARAPRRFLGSEGPCG